MSAAENHILVVEDDPDIAEALGIRLEAAGYEVHIACEGTGATQIMQDVHPGLALLDVSLPGGEDGISVAQRLRDITGDGTPRVLFLTASLRPDLHERALSLPGARLVRKPYDSKELMATIAELTEPAA